MALIPNKDNFGQNKRHLVINRELKYDVKTAIPIETLQASVCLVSLVSIAIACGLEIYLIKALFFL